MADTPLGETVKPESLSNDGQTTATPQVNAVDIAEVERLRKEAMRVRQLENQLEERRRQDEAAERKRREENEEFKTLYDQTQAKLDEVLATQSAQDKRQKLSQATDDILKDYSENVVDLARTAGLSLSDETEDAKMQLKSKLDEIKGKFGGAQRVTPNNPANPAQEVVDRKTLTTRNTDGYSPLAMAEAKGDKSLTYQYINDLPAIKRMKEIARRGV